MQFIEIQLEGENGAVISKSDINFVDVIKKLPQGEDSDFPWLRGIDPYGLTIFNLYQIPHVIEELNELAGQKNDIMPQINKITEFLMRIEQHTYIKFIGD